MKHKTIALAAALTLFSGLASAQSGAPSGRGSTTGDPGNSLKPSLSGSGTSTSGGRDDNADQGRDKMPDSSRGVRPYEKQNKSGRT